MEKHEAVQIKILRKKGFGRKKGHVKTGFSEVIGTCLKGSGSHPLPSQ